MLAVQRPRNRASKLHRSSVIHKLGWFVTFHGNTVYIPSEVSSIPADPLLLVTSSYIPLLRKTPLHNFTAHDVKPQKCPKPWCGSQGHQGWEACEISNTWFSISTTCGWQWRHGSRTHYKTWHAETPWNRSRWVCDRSLEKKHCNWWNWSDETFTCRLLFQYIVFGRMH